MNRKHYRLVGSESAHLILLYMTRFVNLEGRSGVISPARFRTEVCNGRRTVTTVASIYLQAGILLSRSTPLHATLTFYRT